MTIDRERGAGERGGAERRFIQPLAGVLETTAVARGHLDIGKQMMAEGHRLRGLQMREAGHDGCGMFERAIDERLLERGERGIGLVENVADIETEIGRNLVVARTRGVQPAGGGADQLGQAALDIHMDILERALEFEAALADL